MLDLFGDDSEREKGPDAPALAPILLRGLALSVESEILAEIHRVAEAAPFRRMVTPGGYTMSAAMTNCGTVGWVTDRRGYRYDRIDPASGKPWPRMPAAFLDLATTAARKAGFGEFIPDACLVNRYEPGAKLSLHQDKDETDFSAPIVSVSLGLPATFRRWAGNASISPSGKRSSPSPSEAPVRQPRRAAAPPPIARIRPPALPGRPDRTAAP